MTYPLAAMLIATALLGAAIGVLGFWLRFLLDVADDETDDTLAEARTHAPNA